jgi:acetoin utilization deacetylase AcuC-like enzyme
MGFCLLNNAALAAQYLITNHRVNQVAIIDLDVHHGNGTQQIFWERGDVFYLSIHQYPLFPYSGKIEERGYGLGFLKNANLPLPPGSGDEAYLTSFREAVIPILSVVKPEIIIISFGSDTHWRDPLSHQLLSATTIQTIFSELKDWAKENCQGRIVVLLEGGYDILALKICCQAIVAALLGVYWVDPIGRASQRESDAWKKNLEVFIKTWKLK